MSFFVVERIERDSKGRRVGSPAKVRALCMSCEPQRTQSVLQSYQERPGAPKRVLAKPPLQAPSPQVPRCEPNSTCYKKCKIPERVTRLVCRRGGASEPLKLAGSLQGTLGLFLPLQTQRLAVNVVSFLCRWAGAASHSPTTSCNVTARFCTKFHICLRARGDSDSKYPSLSAPLTRPSVGKVLFLSKNGRAMCLVW